ncbi:flavoprotein [Nocardioides insulae]|uniref:flavoprotein n=1 Tax=Nocardioides insulae TaxID=394734 RepID=UPI00048BBDBB|nr:flavoprotein [Nocardioides insulae]
MAVVAVVGCAAGGLEELLDGLIRPLVDHGHTVPVVVTPTAASWLEDLGHDAAIEKVSGLPVRSAPRLPREQSPHPPPDVLVAAPMTANSTAKLALGLADNQALTLLCENLAVKPTIVFPRVNAAHARQPAWNGHLDALRSSGADLVYGEDVWPLYEPRQAPPARRLPWQQIIERIESNTGSASS